MRARALAYAAALASVLLLAACGGSGAGRGREAAGRTRATTPAPGSIAALLERPGPTVSAIPGTEDYASGPTRVSFLLIDGQGRTVDRPRARVWVARSDDAPPFLHTTAVLEQIGAAGSSEPASGELAHIYVARFSVPRPGIYTLVVEPVGGRRVQAELHIQVRARPQAPAVGSKAIASDTPTIRSAHGDLARLTTRVPPDRALLRYSVAESLAAHAPFVLVFATPKFCTSRTCGPVVDVVDAVRRRFAGTAIRFIHVEIYKRNNPALGENRWVKQWHLPTEPWIFLVGRDGRIKARFEGSVSVGELAEAVRRSLAG